jgi:uncharacterized membrane protein
MLTSDRRPNAAADDEPELDEDEPDLAESELAGTPRWVPLTSLLVVAAGLGVSAYLTIAHYESSTILACPGTHLINCERVTTSPESSISGIPVAVLGLVFFAVMAAATLPVAWRLTHPVIRYGRLVAALTGVGMVFYLVYTELFTLDAICLWCTAVHVLTVALFTITLAGTVLTAPARPN